MVRGSTGNTEIYPQADVVLELGGEDAKITYMKPSLRTAYERNMRGGHGSFYRPDGDIA